MDGSVYSVDFQGCLLMECDWSIHLSIHLMQRALGECLLHAKQCAGCHYHRNKAWALLSGPSGVVVGRVRYMVPVHGEQECGAWRGHRGVSPPAAAGERRPLQMTGTAELGGRPVSGQVAWAVGCV